MTQRLKRFAITSALFGLVWLPLSAQADLDRHGPDTWRIQNIAPGQKFNARMGPGTDYPVIETFSHDERGLQQITCVPFFTMAHASVMTDAQRDHLPPRWCLMRAADMSKAGWVAARYLAEDGIGRVDSASDATETTSDDMVIQGQELVRSLYEADTQAAHGGPHPLDPAHAHRYFSSEVVAAMRSQPPGASPLYGAQDFQGDVSAPVPDPDDPMFRGMITINVEIVNFGRPHTAVFRLRADPGQAGSPVRIFAVDHGDWSFP